MKSFNKSIFATLCLASVSAMNAYALANNERFVPCPVAADILQVGEGSAIAVVKDAKIGEQQGMVSFMAISPNIHANSTFTVTGAEYKTVSDINLVCHYLTNEGKPADFVTHSDLASIDDQKILNLGGNYAFDYKGGLFKS